MKKDWWQPPRLRIGGSEEERHATWLEAFYDLVFAVAIAQVSSHLNRNVSWLGFVSFVVLFVPVWRSWLGATFYATRFDNDDLLHRFLTLLQMVAIAALAVNVYSGLGESSAGFALSYSAVRAVLVVEYLHAGRHVVVARPLTRRFARGFGVAAALWLVSAFVPVPLRFVLWALGLLVDFATPIGAGKLHSEFAPHTSHLPERFGLFTLIVLGESIAGAVDGVAKQQWNVSSASSAVFGLSIAFSLWWIYFDCINDTAIRAARAAGRVGVYQTWLYTHLPLAIGLTATGVGVKHVVSSQSGSALPPAERWLICGAVALCLLALEVIYQTSVTTETKQRRQIRDAFRIGSVAIILVLSVVGSLLPVVLIGLVALTCAVQVVLTMHA